MSTRPAPPAGGATPARTVTRRALLVAAGVVPLLGVVVGCTADAPDADAVTPAQVDRLAGQVAAQEELVVAGAAAFAAAPELAAVAAGLAAQWQEQLDRLRAAAPSVTAAATRSTPSSPSPSPSPSTAPTGADTRADLRARVAATADAHAAACLEFTGARAALLGSIAAGLRGHDGLLA